ncbi:MAG: SDR family oxidoreductase [Myxococcota bacterium]
MTTLRRADLSTPKLALASRERVGAALPWVRSEPIAVVGIGCRFPGAEGPEGFLHLLREGIDAVGELPNERWDRERYYDPDPDAPGKTYVTRGGYLEDIAGFDAARFGIAPIEALRMDPQQRLLLEVGWHALEHASIAPESLYGAKAGVFFGISSFDYASVLRQRTPIEELDGYVATGNAFSVAAGRVSYALGLTGPSLAVDTACSSSLVSVHLAMQSLRLRECEVALAGGVNLLLQPESTINFAKARMLAPDGHIKAFDARADGFVRGEGCGVVVLKRLSDALAAGDDVWAVLRGSAVNQDGASSGLTAPNGTAQREVIRAALEGAGVEAAQVGFVEGHGTGTALGDPIELGALAEVYGSSRSEHPLQIGSVKASIGHLESAAGIAGLIKAVLTLRFREIPGQLHFDTPSPHIDWEHSGLEVVRERRPFTPIDGRRLAGVSSFGFSGTNAHVLLEAAPEIRPEETRTSGPHTLVLGARDAARVDALAEVWAEGLEGASEDTVPALVRTAWAGRDRGPERLAVSGADGTELATQLRAALAGTARTGVARGRVRNGSAAGKLGFLFSGQGSAWVGLGLELREREPVFAEVIERCAAVLGERAWLDPGRVAADAVIDTGDAQPALFAFEVAMAELLRSRGLEPDYLLGHSVGELAAACVAGVIELKDAARLVRIRADGMSALPSGGKMVALTADPARVEHAVRGAGTQVSIAAYNGPRQVVVSGAGDAVDAFVASLEVDDARALAVSHAFHSVLMEPALDALSAAVAEIEFQPPRIPLVSSRSGALAGSEIGRPDHWVRQLREPVRFADAVDALWTAGVQEFVEVGPGAALVGLTREILADDPSVMAIPTATRRRGELRSLSDAVGALAVRRADRDLTPWLGEGPRTAEAPRTPFEHTRVWPLEIEGESLGPAAPPSRGERRPVDAWGWTPSVRRLGAPTPVAEPDGPIVVLGDGGADAVAEVFETRGVASLRAALGEPLAERLAEHCGPDVAEDGPPLQLVIVSPNTASTAWAAPLAREFAGAQREIRVSILTSGAVEVTGSETLDAPGTAAAAVAFVLGQEIATARTRHFDLDPAASDLPASLFDDLLATDAGDTPRVVAYRGSHRWAVDYAPAALGNPVDVEADSNHASGDSIVLVGRLAGGLGERIAGHLLRRGATRVVVVGPGMEADPEQSAALERLRASAGDDARVAAHSADIGDPELLSVALQKVHAQYGPVDGVVHVGASGRPEIARLLLQDERETTRAIARERVKGLPALAKALEGWTPRYVLVVSSFAAHVGGIGFGDYAAATAFTETFVRQHARSTDVPWSTVSFEALAEELGHGVDRLDEGSGLRGLALSEEDLVLALDRLGIDPRRGESGPAARHLLVVPSEVGVRVARAHAPASEAEVQPRSSGSAGGGAAPRDEIEEALVEIWEDFLPTRPIGIHDDYFALGGTSLAAVQILARMKARFRAEVPLEALLGNDPTIAAVAETVRQALEEGGSAEATDGDAEVEELLSMVEQLSAEEVERALGDS